jgi:hypothetical protein
MPHNLLLLSEFRHGKSGTGLWNCDGFKRYFATVTVASDGAYFLSTPVKPMPNNLLSDKDVAISNIAGYSA